MSNTANLQLPLISDAQALKHITHNQAIQDLDALVQLSVLDRDLATPPASPAEGDRYLVASGATGPWATQDLKIAAWQNAAWVFFVPIQGWRVWISDEKKLLAWSGSAWTGAAQLTDLLGINATPDLTNRLSVASGASIFNHEGAGHQLKINKNTPADTAGLLLQSGFSGRAELALAGDDKFHLKVSPDGIVWNETLIIDNVTGKVSVKLNSDYAGYLDVSEIAVPADPGANIARLYARDVGGVTKLAMRDSLGAETVLGSGGSGAGFRGVLVSLGANQTIPNGLNTPISWALQSYDTDSAWALSPNPTRFTVPAGVSKIRLTASFLWYSNSAGQRIIQLNKNGALITEYSTYGQDSPNSGGHYAQPAIGPAISVIGGDYFEFVVYQTSGVNLDVIAHSGTWAAMEIIA